MSNKEQANEQFGIDIPAGTGTGLSIESPIKIFTGDNCIKTQFKMILAYLDQYVAFEWDLISQTILTSGENKIECIEIAISNCQERSINAWTEKFYFDVTEFLKMAEKLEV